MVATNTKKLKVVENDQFSRLESMTSEIYSIEQDRHWFSLIVGLKTLPDKGLTENTKLKKLFPS
jgi:hypothetical protein